MSKKELEGKAKELFVIHQMSLADIGRSLNVSTRTLQNWKSAGNWELEKSRVGGSEGAFHAELFQLGEVMARKIKQDEAGGTEVAPERYTALERIIDTAEKSRKYENAAPPKKADDRSPEERQKDAIRRVKNILGIT
ncbi:MAG: phage terminase small subunit-related protein [Sphaerochaetaceae bacterium]|jgi:uncharacterized protein YjcR